MSKDQFVPAYARFAEVYDQVGGDDFGLSLLPRLFLILEDQDASPESALDLCCGTGSVAIALAKKGLKVTGLDLSSAMLEQAREKAAQEGELTTQFVVGDMRYFSIDAPVDLVPCFFDAMNYNLTGEDLSSTFRCVAEALNPGGFFVFDMNSIYALSQVWGDDVFAEDHGDVAYIWDSSYEPLTRISTIRAVFFVRRGDLYERFTEMHVERAYTILEVRQLLNKSGLQLVQVTKTNGKPAGEGDARHLYVARKPD